MQEYDLVIIGAGPAGLTAGIYASRAKLKTLLLERMMPGGQIATTDLVENYPGFASASGMEISQIMFEQAQKFGTEFSSAEVTELELGESDKVVKTAGGEYKAKTVLIATGSASKKMEVPGEDEFIGRGVSYCATCDGPFFEGKTVMVVGGGDAAVEEAIYLTKFAQKVYLVHRRDALRATKFVQEKAFANPKIEFVWDSVVEKINGSEMVENVTVKNVKSGSLQEIVTAGIFIYIGFIPNTQFLQGKVELNEKGYIPTTDQMETSVAGVFAAGDCREKLLRQVVTAAGDGATAAFAAEKFIDCME